MGRLPAKARGVEAKVAALASHPLVEFGVPEIAGMQGMRLSSK
jgi:hypothetical protein